MASYSITNTSDSVTFIVSGVNVGDSLRFFVRPEPATGTLIYDTFRTVDTSPYSVTFGGLSPNASYAVNVYYSVDGTFTDRVVLGTQYFTTSSGPSATVEWSWTASNGLATAAQTQAAYNAITNKGHLSDFSYLVWNDLVSKASEAVSNRGGSWVTTYGSESETLMTASDKNMTARRFNAVLTNLNQYTSTGLSVKSRGDDMLGSYFVTLAAAINTVGSGG